MTEQNQYARMMAVLEKVRDTVQHIEKRLERHPDGKELHEALTELRLLRSEVDEIKPDVKLLMGERGQTVAARAVNSTKWALTSKVAERIGVALLGGAIVAIAWVISQAVG